MIGRRGEGQATSDFRAHRWGTNPLQIVGESAALGMAGNYSRSGIVTRFFEPTANFPQRNSLRASRDINCSSHIRPHGVH